MEDDDVFAFESSHVERPPTHRHNSSNGSNGIANPSHAPVLRAGAGAGSGAALAGAALGLARRGSGVGLIPTPPTPTTATAAAAAAASVHTTATAAAAATATSATTVPYERLGMTAPPYGLLHAHHSHGPLAAHQQPPPLSSSSSSSGLLLHASPSSSSPSSSSLGAAGVHAAAALLPDPNAAPAIGTGIGALGRASRHSPQSPQRPTQPPSSPQRQHIPVHDSTGLRGGGSGGQQSGSRPAASPHGAAGAHVDAVQDHRDHHHHHHHYKAIQGHGHQHGADYYGSDSHEDGRGAAANERGGAEQPSHTEPWTLAGDGARQQQQPIKKRRHRHRRGSSSGSIGRLTLAQNEGDEGAGVADVEELDDEFVLSNSGLQGNWTTAAAAAAAAAATTPATAAIFHFHKPASPTRAHANEGLLGARPPPIATPALPLSHAAAPSSSIHAAAGNTTAALSTSPPPTTTQHNPHGPPPSPGAVSSSSGGSRQRHRSRSNPAKVANAGGAAGANACEVKNTVIVVKNLPFSLNPEDMKLCLTASRVKEAAALSSLGLSTLPEADDPVFLPSSEDNGVSLLATVKGPLLDSLPPFLDVELCYDANGHSRGVAFVTYANLDDSERAHGIIGSGVEVGGRRLLVEYKRQQPPSAPNSTNSSKEVTTAAAVVTVTLANFSIQATHHQQHPHLPHHHHHHHQQQHHHHFSGPSLVQSEPHHSSTDALDAVHATADDEARLLHTQLKSFKYNDTMTVMEFPAHFSAHQRKLVHMMAERLDLNHASEGDGHIRTIKVWKKIAPKPSILATLPDAPTETTAELDTTVFRPRSQTLDGHHSGRSSSSSSSHPRGGGAHHQHQRGTTPSPPLSNQSSPTAPERSMPAGSRSSASSIPLMQLPSSHRRQRPSVDYSASLSLSGSMGQLHSGSSGVGLIGDVPVTGGLTRRSFQRSNDSLSGSLSSSSYLGLSALAPPSQSLVPTPYSSSPSNATSPSLLNPASLPFTALSPGRSASNIEAVVASTDGSNSSGSTTGSGGVSARQPRGPDGTKGFAFPRSGEPTPQDFVDALLSSVAREHGQQQYQQQQHQHHQRHGAAAIGLATHRALLRDPVVAPAPVSRLPPSSHANTVARQQLQDLAQQALLVTPPHPSSTGTGTAMAGSSLPAASFMYSSMPVRIPSSRAAARSDKGERNSSVSGSASGLATPFTSLASSEVGSFKLNPHASSFDLEGAAPGSQPYSRR